MSQKVSTSAIGAFVLGSVVILIACVVWISGSSFGTDKSRAVMVFDSSVKGLRVGAPLALKGVTIGEVINIDIVIDVDTFKVFMPVTIEINNNKVRRVGVDNINDNDIMPELIEKGLRGQLRTQSLLTGLLFIQMDFHPNSPIRNPNIKTDYEQLPTIPTDMAELSRSLATIDVPRLINETQSTLTAINDLMTSEQTQLSTEHLNDALLAVTRLSDQLGGVTPELEALMTNSNEAVTSIRQQIPQLSSDIQTSLAQFNKAAAKFEAVMSSADYSLSDDSPVVYEVIKAAQELARAGKSLQSLAETLEAQPESILKGKSPLR